MFDPAKAERIAPDYWRNSQLSVCRFSGGGIIQGVKYTLCPVTDYLVRDDIYKKEFDRAKWAAAEKAKWNKLKNKIQQGGLF